MRRIVVVLFDDAADALTRRARAAFRHPRDEAAAILDCALVDRRPGGRDVAGDTVADRGHSNAED